MVEINELKSNEPSIYFLNKKLKLKKVTQNLNSIFLYYSKLELKEFSKINVVLQNIKTREEYKCKFDSTNEYIEIHLDTLTDYFTDYEATIFITLQKDKMLYYYIPIVASCELSDIKKQTYSNSNYRWFIRTSPNKELRLSCYKLITA
ncbi:MAG: hypothetical protein MJ191_05030 [Clostridium sp.]|nr:hypothetical protein [Clostridium sp.]